ncbi:polysaccharide lyase [uncultured Aquimarina sp.]|uniref:polysaccharide lyase n=1 Tax=uncultured Aquimarina sp. TaxID=575652 RepID=UPI0026180FF1|nr:T9SS type A sorting domain-containing protein [uncultured Aquimarina sp.]
MKTPNLNKIWKHKIIIIFLLICTGIRAQDCNNSQLVVDQDFSQYNGENQLYTRSMANNDFPNLGGRTSGGNVRGLSNDFPQRNRVINGELRAEFTKDDASGRTGGFVFDSSFDGVEEAVLQYRVKFADDFVWATGGKLPGLGGASTPNGSQPAGCTQNQNTIENAFSCRLMWRSNTAHTQPPYLIVYDYLPNRETRCGGNTRLGDLKLERNTWYTVKQYLKLNTPGQENGVLKMYIDGELLVDLDDVMFRLSGKGSVKINSVVMHTYRGGNRSDDWWQSPQDDYVYFDDFKVWTNCSDATDNGENQLPVISFNEPTSQTVTLEEGNNLMVNVAASDPDGTIENVKLYMDNVEIREEVNPPYEWGHRDDLDEQLKNLVAGTYQMKAVATDNRGGTSEISFELVVEENVLSVDEFDASDLKIKIYPNPADNIIFIENEGNTTQAIQIKINDVSGRTIKTITSNSSVIEINTSALSSGMFLMTVKSGKLSTSKLLVKK